MRRDRNENPEEDNVPEEVKVPKEVVRRVKEFDTRRKEINMGMQNFIVGVAVGLGVDTIKYQFDFNKGAFVLIKEKVNANN